MPLAGGAAETLPGFYSWVNPDGFTAAAEGFYITATSNSVGRLFLARSAYYTTATGWESLVVASGLTSPGQICGISGSTLYLVTGLGTAITAVNTGTGVATTAVSGLTATASCAFDAGGSGDLILGDEANILVVPAASLASLPVTRGSLSPVFNVGTTSGAPSSATVIMGIAGKTATSTFYVFKGGYRTATPSTAATSQVLRVESTGTTTLWTGLTVIAGPKYPSTSAPFWFGGGLALSSSNELYATRVESSNYMWRLASADTAASNTAAAVVGTGGQVTTNSLRSTNYVSILGTSIYTAKGGAVYQAC